MITSDNQKAKGDQRVSSGLVQCICVSNGTKANLAEYVNLWQENVSE